MYEQHFGFSRPVFADGLAQDDAVFRTDATGALGRDLEVALKRRDAVAVLTGPSGCGKTTIAADALKGISTRLAFTCLSQPPLTPHELLEQLLTDFGFEPYKRSRVERLQLWRQFLSEMTATDTRVCLLVENAAQFDPDVQTSLQTLTAADAALSPGANIILTTTRPAETVFVGPRMHAFSQRIRLRRAIAPLCAAEIEAFLDFKCALGEVPRATVFADDLAPVLQELSGGIIRIIDNLLETALTAAAANGAKTVTAAQVEEIAEQHYGMTLLAPTAVDELLEQAQDDDLDIPTLTDYVAETADNLIPLRGSLRQH
jgi:type II secretory pathway predicted ATPase ExeA